MRQWQGQMDTMENYVIVAEKKTRQLSGNVQIPVHHTSTRPSPHHPSPHRSSPYHPTFNNDNKPQQPNHQLADIWSKRLCRRMTGMQSCFRTCLVAEKLVLGLYSFVLCSSGTL